MDRADLVANAWRWKCGVQEQPHRSAQQPKFNFAELRVSEWSPEFEKKMRNRLIFGAIRYGRMGHGSIPKGKPVYDRCASIRARLERFEQTGNAEWLIDIANMALLTYEERVHPRFHFEAVDEAHETSYHDKILKL